MHIRGPSLFVVALLAKSMVRNFAKTYLGDAHKIGTYKPLKLYSLFPGSLAGDGTSCKAASTSMSYRDLCNHSLYENLQTIRIECM